MYNEEISLRGGRTEYTTDEFPEKSGLAGWLVKISGGMIKNKKQANMVILACAIIFFVLAIMVFTSGPNEQVPLLPPSAT